MTAIVQKSNIFKVCIQNVLHVLECKPGCFINDHLVEMFPLFDQTRLQLGDVMNPAAVHALLQLPPDQVVYQTEITIDRDLER